MKRSSLNFLILFFLLFSISASAECGTSKNHIVFIHGIASNKGAFGYWDQYVQKFHKDECLSSHFFEYDTGNNRLSLNDFVESFNEFMHQESLSEGKIKIVAHSQGGLITLYWLKRMLDNNDTIRFRVNGLMTMATPYYGAKIANLGYSLGTFILPILGKKELKDMRIGSKQVMQTYELFNNKDFLFYLKGLNFISISALFAPNLFDVEGDFAVAPYSSNPNVVLGNNISKHYNIHGVHLRFNLPRTPATTYVTKTCLEKPELCKNSSLAIFEKEFLTQQYVSIDKAEDINTFAVYLKFEKDSLPSGPIFVGSKGILRGLAIKFHHIRDGLYYYKGRLSSGDSKGYLRTYIDGNKILIPVKASRSTFITR
ncbi:lipase family alpha/beta hydrolase [Halobacteriovorax sp.]|uniref:lipase family alpha/beta hydrolase n=1 Tax=Halobacteriovorax sp. TaxID=2020862 RepID=UPI003AF2E526